MGRNLQLVAKKRAPQTFLNTVFKRNVAQQHAGVTALRLRLVCC